MSLQGKRAVVTGASRGIGAAIAGALAEAGASVLLAARGADALERTAAQLRGKGANARALACDAADPAGIEALAAGADEHLGGADILVNNAGLAMSGPLSRITLEDWNRALAVNATGPYLCTKAFLPAMRERGFGRVVNLASTAGLAGAPYTAAYSAAKHALVGFTRAVAAEIRGSGVTVNAVCPGYVDTEMTQRSLDRIVEKTNKSREEALRSILAVASQARLVRPEEVAHAVVSLCGDDAGAIHGQAIVVDGGGLLG